MENISKDAKCSLCKEKDEKTDRIVSGCSKIAQSDYKNCHNEVAAVLHWNLCKKCGTPGKKQWERMPKKGVGNELVKILWNFKIQTDKKLEHDTPDIMVVEKKPGMLTDVAIPGNN